MNMVRKDYDDSTGLPQQVEVSLLILLFRRGMEGPGHPSEGFSLSGLGRYFAWRAALASSLRHEPERERCQFLGYILVHR